jgi:hypothetical protein
MVAPLVGAALRVGAKKIGKKLAEKEAPIVVGGAGVSGGSYISAAESAKKREQETRESADEKKREARGMKKGGWIKEAIKKPGALRKSLGVKKGEKIPAGKLAAAAKKPGKMGQRARLAQTLKKMK